MHGRSRTRQDSLPRVLPGRLGADQSYPSNVLETTTMCGHAMISADLVRKMAGEDERGSEDGGEAAYRDVQVLYLRELQPDAWDQAS